jgi:hypothetical protein
MPNVKTILVWSLDFGLDLTFELCHLGILPMGLPRSARNDKKEK